MLPDDPPVLPQLDPLGVGADLDRRPTALAITEYLLLSKRTRQVFDGEKSTRRCFAAAFVGHAALLS
jgi:hypothetical protein